ncbi:LOG family protein [Candidatus Pacearchaeota archaeon]|nr:LOG family protein [Candidatus Pacearchaeota archaeon]
MKVESIGVFGSASSDDTRVIEQAREVGREIATRGLLLVTGAGMGLPYEAVRGANELGGEVLGYSPATNEDEHIRSYKFPIEGFSNIIYMPTYLSNRDRPFILANQQMCKKLRNVLSVWRANAGIIVGGRIGTMNEFTLLYDMGKSIGILEGSGGITTEAIKVLLRDAGKSSKSQIVLDSNPASLIEKLVNVCDSRQFA